MVVVVVVMVVVVEGKEGEVETKQVKEGGGERRDYEWVG